MDKQKRTKDEVVHEWRMKRSAARMKSDEKSLRELDTAYSEELKGIMDKDGIPDVDNPPLQIPASMLKSIKKKETEEDD